MNTAAQGAQGGVLLERKLNHEERTALLGKLQERLRALFGAGPHPVEEMLPEYILTMVENRRSAEFMAGELNSLLAGERAGLGDEIIQLVSGELRQLSTDAASQREQKRSRPGKSLENDHEVHETQNANASKGDVDGKRDACALNQEAQTTATSEGRQALPVEQSPAALNGAENLAARPASDSESVHNREPQLDKRSTSATGKRQQQRTSREARTSQRQVSHTGETWKKRRMENENASQQRGELMDEPVQTRDEAPTQSTPAEKQTTGPQDSNACDSDPGSASTASDLPPRCQFWPNCRNASACKFHHPTELCRFYPNCRSGDRCRFIHPTSRSGSSATLALMRKAMGMPLHHGIPIPCKYGFACERRRKDRSCPYAHPLLACRYGKDCRKIALGTCAFSHAPLCRYGWSCTRPGCTFAHPAQESGTESPEQADANRSRGESVTTPSSDAEMDNAQAPMMVSES
jgi:hypothetical protein